MKKTIIFLSLFVAVITEAQNWNLTGNAGTNPPSTFLGTTDNKSLVFKTNNIEWLKINSYGRFVFNNIDLGPGYNSNLLFGGGNDMLTSKGNSAFGVGSLLSASSGGFNTAIGANSLLSNTTGFNNTSLGGNSLMGNIIGNNNTGIGTNALGIAKGNLNTSVGSHALFGNSTGTDFYGDNNTAVGGFALRGVRFNSSNNTAIGAQSLILLRTGSNNIAIGYNSANIELTNANNNIFIGSDVQPTSSSPSNELNIGNWIYGKYGTIGIGTSQVDCSSCVGYKLFVKDGIKTEKVKVEIAANNGWADYVFKEDYQLMPLKELEGFINENGHLPEVPTTEEAIKNGIELKEMNILLLKKIEELTLHLIEQDKRINELENNR